MAVLESVLHWLLTPLSGAAVHVIEPWAFWHARLMVLAWAVLLPLGALVARFYKIRPTSQWPERLDDKLWWHTHRTAQYGGTLLMLAGLLLAWLYAADVDHPAGSTVWWHHLLGWSVVLMALSQVLGGWFRGSKGGPTDRQLRGDHYDMTLRRRAFEVLHKGIGWLSVGLSVVVIATGLVVSDAPRWMGVALVAWYLLLTFSFIRLQHQGRCRDTYHAIWGPDAAHPGNALRPTGWGIRR